MKKILKISYLFFCIVLISSCLNKKSTSSTPSSDPSVKTMVFLANDSFPGLVKASFYVEEGLDTGRIYNVDSILYGTAIDSVGVRITYNHTPAAATIFTPEDTISLRGNDVIDFTKRPMRLFVVAEDLLHSKWYNVEVNVHQVDPDLFVWERLADNAFENDYTMQKAFWLNKQLVLFLSNGIDIKLQVSANGMEWSEMTITGLPSDCDVFRIVQLGEKVYYSAGNSIYESSDGMTWQKEDLDRDFDLLFAFNDSLWGITTDSGIAKLAVKDNNEFLIKADVPEQFPISDFAFTEFTSVSGRKRAMLVGGYDTKGRVLNTRWNIEFSDNSGYSWVDFSKGRQSFSKVIGASLIYYDKQFLMFGGADENNVIGTYDMLSSDDNGMTWVVPDSTHNCLPQDYESRAKQSVVIDDKYNIYIIGGQNRTQAITDIYRGKLNSVDWESK